MLGHSFLAQSYCAYSPACHGFHAYNVVRLLAMDNRVGSCLYEAVPSVEHLSSGWSVA